MRSEPPNKPRVAVVDDEELMRSGLRRWLSEDFDVSAYGSGREFLRALPDDGHFDVVLIDHSMPEMNGARLIAELVEAHPDLLQRCVLMTGRTLDELGRTLLDQVGGRVVQKPFVISGLLAFLRLFVYGAQEE